MLPNLNVRHFAEENSEESGEDDKRSGEATADEA
jgi:hypothetical protein